MSTAPKQLALQALKLASGAVDAATPKRRGVTVLTYHRVGTGTRLQLDLPVEIFDAQMAELAAQQRVVSIDDALDRVRSTEVPAADPVVVTFDDGTADWIDNALPVLVRHQVPATFYVATHFVEQPRDFPYAGHPVSWAGLRDALATGLVTIGSHTHTHALLDRCAPDDASEELTRSARLIEDRLGVTADHLAYPKSLAPTPATERLVRQRFRSAALAGTRPNPYGRTDPHRLSRSSIQQSDGMRWFRHKARGGMAFEDVVRRTTNRVRYREATT